MEFPKSESNQQQWLTASMRLTHCRCDRATHLQMNTKSVFLIIFLAVAPSLSDLADDAISVQKASDGWQTHAYTQIGLQLRLPSWKADIEDQKRMWSLLGYPLVANPVTDVQYRVVISARRCTMEQHLRWYPRSGTNTSEWMNLQHLQTSQMTNAFWIYSRRDVFGSNGFAYFCEGTIKRDANLKPKDVNRLDEDEKSSQ